MVLVEGAETVIDPNTTYIEPGKIYRMSWQVTGLYTFAGVDVNAAYADAQRAISQQLTLAGYSPPIMRGADFNESTKVVTIDFEVPASGATAFSESGAPYFDFVFTPLLVAVIVIAVASVLIVYLWHLTVMKVAEVNPSALPGYGPGAIFSGLGEVLKWVVIGGLAIGGVYVAVKVLPAAFKSDRRSRNGNRSRNGRLDWL